jgi:Alw26I/Eco31I/Esp3I family type II restriction m6 adenine DNA methyltransferase
LDRIRENAFVVIYRLLFILYAEDRGFLPLENPGYRETYSLRALAKEIAQKIDGKAGLSPAASGYWSRLQDLFRMIDAGDTALGIPPYNGGLFEESRHAELSQWKVGDSYLARAVDMLARAGAAERTGRGFVSYRELSIRELGSIYEGLLEHRPRIAEEPMVVVRDDKTERVISEKEAQGKKVLGRYEPEEVYLTLHRGERKATGSYYTPDYIVKYIVANTVGPLIEGKKAEGGDLIEGIQSLKVLDPAMGSGHFLVEATDFLARALVEALGGDPREPGEDDIRWARREVVERCIYGVDLNPLAVELAKLSLWLHTVSRDRPLNFLDHHLRCGNSLIGAWLKDLGQLPELAVKGTKKKAKVPTAVTTLEGHGLQEAIAAAVKTFHAIAEAPTHTLEDVHTKEDAYRTARHALSRITDIADVWTSTCFGNQVDPDRYARLLLDAYRGDGDWPGAGESAWLDEARNMGRQERRFLHWELEFPEVFFGRDGSPLQKAGFDGVIGNPPYDVIAEKEQEVEVEADKEFYAHREHLKAALGGKLNFYRLFGALALRLCREGGCHGFIVPMALMGDAQAVRLRRYMLSESQLNAIEAFPQKDDPTDRVFEDAKLSTCVYVLRRAKPSVPFALRIHPGRAILDTSPQVHLTRNDLALLDSEYLPIPSSPGTDARHVALAVALARRCAGHRFGEVASSQQGEVNLTAHAKLLTSSPVGPEVLRGAHLDRYEFKEQPKQGVPAYLDVEEFLRGKPPGSRAFDHRWGRIGYQRGAAIDNWRRIIACVIEPGSFCSDTVNYIVRPKLAFFFVLGLLNSSLFEWRFRLTSTNNHVNAYEVDGLPLRPIALATEEGISEKEVGGFRTAYESALKSGDLISAAGCVERYLPWLRPGQPEKEQSDVVHDILAHLAEELTGAIRRKQAEAKAFLGWLEGYLGLKTDELKSKTKIREYFALERGWDEFAAVLEQNRRAIQRAKGIDVTRREPREAIRQEYEASMARLRPLLRKIELTDRLIDLIVYRLYGLTDEEIAIVEGRA